MAVYAKTKEDLKKYINNKETEIIVNGKLARQLKKCEPLKKATPVKIAILSASVVAVRAFITPMLITGVPIIGSPDFIVTPFIVFEARKIASSFVIRTNAAITMLILASSLGVETLVSLFKDYKTLIKKDIGLNKLYIKFKRTKAK